jgi:glycosyltransferase involved in cell wall biosynthesis
MAIGRPIVASRLEQIEEVLEHGKTAVLVEPGDVDGYRAAILRLLRDEELRASCENAARARARQFSYDSFRRSIMELCGNVLSE